MKFEIQQEDLQKALDVIANVVPAKTTLPILTCVLMEAGGRSSDAVGHQPGYFHHHLHRQGGHQGRGQGGHSRGQVRALRAQPASRSGDHLPEAASRSSWIRGKARLTENTMNVDEYPALKKLEEKNGLDMEAAILIDMINETSYSVSRDETRPALMGILWEIRTDSLTLVATDAHRLARSRRSMDWDVPGDREMIVDTAGLRHLPRIVSGLHRR